MKRPRRNRIGTNARLAVGALAVAFAIPALASSSVASTSHASSGGTLNWYGAGSVTSWYPALSTAGNDVKSLSLVYAGLTNLNPEGVAIPDLASSWSFAKNGLSVTFTLRPHLVFSDGTPLNAEAVKINLDNNRLNPLSLVSTLLPSIKSETVLSPTEIRINLNELDWELPATLAGKAGELVSPKALKDPTALATAPVGAGPFKVTQYVAEGYTDLVKNPRYWDAKDIHIKKIYMSGVTTASTVLAALQSNEANYAQIQGNQVSAAEAAGFQIHVIQQFAVSYLAVNQKIAPFNNPYVTQAIGYAINRQALAQAQGFGYAKADDEPFPSTYFGYSPAVSDYWSYDPTKAAQLLAKAGYPGGKGLTLTLTSTLPSPISEQIQGELEALGVTVNIVGIPATESTQLEYVEHNVAFFPNGFVGRESPVAALTIVYGQNGLLNPSRIISNQLATDIDLLRRTPTVPFANYQKELQSVVDLAVQQSSVYFLFQSPMILATKGVTGIQKFIDFQQFEGVQLGS